MIRMNNLMKDTINKCTKENKDEDKKIEKICNEIVRKTKLIEDCVLYDPRNKLDENNYEIKFWGPCTDYTSYEMWDNELAFDIDIISHNKILDFLEVLDLKLMEKFKDRKFCVVVYLDSDIFFVRFHTYREEEGLYYCEDAESYTDNPFVYRLNL